MTFADSSASMAACLMGSQVSEPAYSADPRSVALSKLLKVSSQQHGNGRSLGHS